MPPASRLEFGRSRSTALAGIWFSAHTEALPFVGQFGAAGSRALSKRLDSWLLQDLCVTGPIGRLVGRGGRSGPGGVLEIEELGHIHLGSVALRKRRNVEPGFDEFQNRGVVGGRVGHIV